MPLKKARKGSSKKARQRVVSSVMHELKHHGKKRRSQKQMVAIALKQAGLSRKKKSKKR
jgi:hypothetical protein